MKEIYCKYFWLLRNSIIHLHTLKSKQQFQVFEMFMVNRMSMIDVSDIFDIL